MNKEQDFSLEGLEDRILMTASPMEAEMVVQASANESVQSTQSILIIDTSVEGYQALINELSADNTEIHFLDSNADGVEQISTILSQYENLDSVHIVSHGSEASLQLGNSKLSSKTINSYSDELSSWKQSLSTDADILFYGCETGHGTQGQAFLNKIADLTGADIAASSDITGVDGDAELEVKVGTIETQEIFTQAQLEEAGIKLTLLDNTTGIAGLSGSQSNFTVQTFTLTSPGSGTSGTDTTSADSSLGAAELVEVTFHSAPSGSGTAGSLFVDIYDGSAGDTGMYLGSSSNSIDVNTAVGTNSQLTWTFGPGITLNRASTYSLVFSTDAVAGSSVSARLSAAKVGGSFIDSHAGGVASNNADASSPAAFDSAFSVTTNSAPTTTTTVGLSPSFTEGVSSAVNLFNNADFTPTDSGQAFNSISFDVTNLVDSTTNAGDLEQLTFNDGTNAAQAFNLDTLAATALNGGGEISITHAGGTSTVTLDFTAGVASTRTAAEINTIINNLQYEHLGNGSDFTDSSSPVVTITSITDNGGGSVATLSPALSSTINRIANTAPTLGNLNGDALAYDEGDGAQILDQATALTLSDTTSPDFNGGNLTVTITSGEDAAEDLLSFEIAGPGAVTISGSGITAGDTVSVGGVAVGTLANNIAAGNDLIVNFNSVMATPALVQTLAQAATYENTDTDNPTTGARNIRFTVTDGDGGSETSTNNDITVTVSGVNDAPSLTGDLSAAINRGDTYVILAADLGYSDVDDGDADVTFNVSGETNGTVQVGGMAVSSFTGTQLVANLVSFVHDNTATTAASFDVNVEDGNEDSSVPVDSTFNFTVDITPVAVDDPSYNADEDTQLTVNAATGVLNNDINIVTATVSEINGTGLLTGTSAKGATVTMLADGSFTYDPNGQFETLADGVTTTDTFTYTLADGKDSADFAYKYEMDVDPSTQNLDGAGSASDWFAGTASGSIIPQNYSGGIASSDQSAATPEVLFRTDFGGSISRTSLAGDYTIEVAVQVLGPAASAGAFGIALGTNSSNSLRLNIGLNDVNLNGGINSVATASNSDAMHVYRISFTDATDTYSVWRDDVLIYDNISGTNGGFGDMFIGDFSGTLGGEWKVDYIRLDDSVSTPVTTSTATATITITGVNDAPTITGDLTETINRGATHILVAADLGYSDVDDGDADVTFNVSGEANGTVQVGGMAVSSFTGTQLVAGQVSFVHDNSATTSASFDVNVEDGNEDSSAPVNSTFNFTVDITPVAVDDPSYNADEDTQLTVNAVTGVLNNDINVVTATVSEINGTGLLTGTSAKGATVTMVADGSFTYDPNGQFETLADGATTTDTFTYTLADGKDSAGFKYKYEMDANPSTQDLDANLTNDWFGGTAGGVTSPQDYTGGVASSDQTAGTPEVLFRTDINNSISRVLTGDYSIEVAVQVLGPIDSGDVGGFMIGLDSPDDKPSLRLNIGLNDVNLDFDGNSSVATTSNSDAMHIYRVSYTTATNEYSVWRDGVLIYDAINGTNGNISGGGAFYIGDPTGTVSGEWNVDYIRLDDSISTPVTTSTATATITITGVNDAPTLSDTIVTLSPVLEDAGAPTGAVGTLISSLVSATNVADIDTGSTVGVAITNADVTNGTWHFSTNNGTTWQALGTPSDAMARLLTANATNRVYFQPNADFNGDITNALTFRAWDSTSGSNGTIADASTNGDATAFSSVTDTASLTITAVNDAPTLTGDLAETIDEAATYTLTTTDLSYMDIDDMDAGVTFTVGTFLNGKIQVNGIDATTFTGTQLTAGQVTFVHDGSETLAASFDVSVEDGNEDSSTPTSQTFNFTITPVNDAPVVNSTASQSVEENSTLTLDFDASDVDSPLGNIVFSLDAASLAAGMTIDPATGAFSWTPGLGTAGTYTVIVSANDMDMMSPEVGTFSFTIEVATIPVPVNLLSGNPSDPAEIGNIAEETSTSQTSSTSSSSDNGIITNPAALNDDSFESLDEDNTNLLSTESNDGFESFEPIFTASFAPEQQDTAPTSTSDSTGTSSESSTAETQPTTGSETESKPAPAASTESAQKSEAIANELVEAIDQILDKPASNEIVLQDIQDDQQEATEGDLEEKKKKNSEKESSKELTTEEKVLKDETQQVEQDIFIDEQEGGRVNPDGSDDDVNVQPDAGASLEEISFELISFDESEMILASADTLDQSCLDSMQSIDEALSGKFNTFSV